MTDWRTPGAKLVRGVFAAGDGITDDTAAIQAAIDAAAAAGGGEVLLPAGGTYLSGGLTLKAGVTLRIPTGTTLTAAPSTLYFIQTEVSAANTAVVGGGTIAANGNVSGAILRSVGATEGFDVRDVTVTDVDGTCFVGVEVLTGSTRTRLAGCTFDGVRNSLRAFGDVSRLRVVGNVVRNWWVRGFWVAGSSTHAPSDVHIQDNQVVDLGGGAARYPIVTESAGPLLDGVVVQGNVVVGPDLSFKDPTTPGTADQIAVRNVERFVVADNLSIDGGEVGISTEDCHEGTLSGNTVVRADGVGLMVGGAAGSGRDTDISVSGNTFVNSGLDRAGEQNLQHGGIGVVVRDADRINLSGNTIVDNQSAPTMNYGVLVDGSSEVDWGGNLIAGYGTGPFIDNGGNTDVGGPCITGSTDTEKVASIVSALAALGLATDDTT